MNFIDNFSKVENFKKHCFYCNNYAKHKCKKLNSKKFLIGQKHVEKKKFQIIKKN